MFSSFACYLADLGFVDKAGLITEQAIIDKQPAYAVRAFFAFLEKFLPKWKKLRQPKDFDLLRYHGVQPVVAILLGEDGSCNHAVTVSNRIVYDSNLPQAYPLFPEVLDWCVSSETQKTKFQRCHVAYRIEMPKKDRKRVAQYYQMPRKKSKQD